MTMGSSGARASAVGWRTWWPSAAAASSAADQEGQRPLDQLVLGQATDPLAVEPVEPLGIEDGPGRLHAREVEALLQILAG